MHVVDGLCGLLLDSIAHQFSRGRVNWSGARHEDEISGTPSLGISALRGRTSLALNYVFGHALVSCWCQKYISRDNEHDRTDRFVAGVIRSDNLCRAYRSAICL